jgi:phage terminase small subunit
VPILKNSKHEMFAHGVAKGVAIAQAYIDAGFSEKGANPSGARLLRNATIAARVDEIKANIEKSVEAKVGVSKAWVIEKLQQNLARAMQEVEICDNKGKGTGEFRYEGNVANKALELIGKELGMFKDRQVLENPDGSALSLQITYVGTKDH